MRPLRDGGRCIMKKVMVIGSPWAGKSTFARKLRDATGLPLFYLDMIWHKPDQTNVSVEEFDRRLGEIVEKDQWIIDGNYQRTLEVRLKVCDTVFLLDYPLECCLSGAEARIGRKREEQLPQIYKMLEQYGEMKKLVIFHTREEADLYLQQRNF